MKVRGITTPITSLSGIGTAAEKNFARLNIFTVGDLLTHYPRDYEDRTKHVALCEYEKAKVNTIAHVVSHEWFGFGKMRTLKIVINDGTATANLICFNRPFLEKKHPVNSTVYVCGSFFVKYGELQSSDFSAENSPFNGILPVYALTENITQAHMRKTVLTALSEYCKGIENEIPIDVIERNNLLQKQEAILKIHTPKTVEEATHARYTLIFEELFQFQTALGKRVLERRGTLIFDENQNNQKDFTYDDFIRSLSPKQKQLLERIPFALTADQKSVISTINKDIDSGFAHKEQKPIPMARLLQGDVGSGKTLVAFFAALRIVDWGSQAAFLAPTELLARQHAQNAAQLIDGICTLAFLTGNVKAEGRRNLLHELKLGNIDIIIGTHALFSQEVQYKNLKLAVIDEQHRFGVMQRNAIIAKGLKSTENQNDYFEPPHLLLMSATPIPQTLAHTVFGDLDISVIKTMPIGRKPVQTHLTKHGSEKNVFDFVKGELQKGRQAYFVYPLIESSDADSRTANLKDAKTMFDFLQNKIFTQYKAALIHSMVNEAEQRSIMQDFKNKNVQILVATSVVEVGVDVPNATCMVIEHAERFGLAALHQLRGRVGRGNEQSHCFLIYAKNLTDIAKERLKVLYENTDGFIIAERDLELRGPGEVLGVQQSGYFTLSIADPIRDRAIMQKARQEAFSQLSY